MKKLTLKSFLNHTHINKKLVRSTIKQFGNWEYFKESASDICNYGASGGFAGFTYYSDTVAFTKRNKKAIFEFCREYSLELGESGSVSAFLKGFNCLKSETMAEIEDGLYNPKSDNQTTIFNALAWFALEEIARSFEDFKESLKDN